MKKWITTGTSLRSFLWELGANVGSIDKPLRIELVAEFVALDTQADSRGFLQPEWEHPNLTENKVLSILHGEEEYWCHRRV